jgi:hypothetical protein
MPLPQAATEGRVVSTVETLPRNRRPRGHSVERLTRQGFNAFGRRESLIATPFDQGGELGYALAMSTDATLTLQRIMDFCHEKWGEADKAPAGDWPTPDMLTGKKMAFNDVLQFARKLLGEAS